MQFDLELILDNRETPVRVGLSHGEDFTFQEQVSESSPTDDAPAPADLPNIAFSSFVGNLQDERLVSESAKGILGARVSPVGISPGRVTGVTLIRISEERISL